MHGSIDRDTWREAESNARALESRMYDLRGRVLTASRLVPRSIEEALWSAEHLVRDLRAMRSQVGAGTEVRELCIEAS